MIRKKRRRGDWEEKQGNYFLLKPIRDNIPPGFPRTLDLPPLHAQESSGSRLYSRWHLEACSVANIPRGVMGTTVNPDRCRIRVDGQIQFEYGAVRIWEFLNPEKRSC